MSVLLKARLSERSTGDPPRQVAPLLADKGMYIASESTMYRILAEAVRQDKTPTERPASLVGTTSPPSM